MPGTRSISTSRRSMVMIPDFTPIIWIWRLFILLIVVDLLLLAAWILVF
jgi:hypothetical protein